MHNAIHLRTAHSCVELVTDCTFLCIIRYLVTLKALMIDITVKHNEKNVHF